jgi:hypothetical protein
MHGWQVNNTPAFGNNMSIDNSLFFPLVADTFTLLGLEIANPCSAGGPGKEEGGSRSSGDGGSSGGGQRPSLADRFDDQVARRRHFRCVFPHPSTVEAWQPLVQTQSPEAQALYAHVARGGR